MSDFMIGSIDLSKIDKNLIKSVKMKDGSTHLFLNVTVTKRKSPSQFGDTHFVSTAPKGTPVEGRNKYIIGDLKEWQEPAPDRPTMEEIRSAPFIAEAEKSDLPF